MSLPGSSSVEAVKDFSDRASRIDYSATGINPRAARFSAWIRNHLLLISRHHHRQRWCPSIHARVCLAAISCLAL